MRYVLAKPKRSLEKTANIIAVGIALCVNGKSGELNAFRRSTTARTVAVARPLRAVGVKCAIDHHGISTRSTASSNIASLRL